MYTYDNFTKKEPPSCYGKSYDNETRECQGCKFQTNCRDEVIKARNNMSTTTDYYRNFGYGGANIMPLRSPVAQAPTPQILPQYPQYPPNRPTLFPSATPQLSQIVPVGYPTPARYGEYGWLQDTLHYTMASSPTPMRPQMPGESFGERAMKNAGLAMAEAFFMQAVLAVRQLVLAPNALPQTEHQQIVRPEAPRSVPLPIVQIVPERPR